MAVVARSQAQSVVRRDARRRNWDRASRWAVGAAGGITSAMIVLLLVAILIKGLPAINWEFLSSPPTNGMTAGGIWPMIRGSILLMAGAFIVALPLGVLAGVCLAEYAGQSQFARLMRASVTSLAGTPSIVYGLFGLAIFVLKFHMKISLLAGCCTLALFALPVIVLTTEQAIKMVPESFIDGGLALGLSRWQTIRRIVLPNALPGILTGVVLASGRAAGEAPPILLTAGIYYASGALTFGWETLKRPVANLPYHLAEGYRQGGVIPERTIWGTCLTLMLLVLLLNLASLIVRARLRRKQAW
jgi:phosphate transport system permease protein